MAMRPYYYVSNGRVREQYVDFQWHAGLSATQKKRSVRELHETAFKEFNVRLLEVSSKSDEEIGEMLSAFNLRCGESTVENYYQAGKIFENGGPYEDLICCSPKEAKRDNRLKESGRIVGFHDFITGEDWSDAFYYELYINALKRQLSDDELEQLVLYDGYTDIEFNPAKGINTQAKACAIVKLLIGMYGEIPELNKKDFECFYKTFAM